MKSREIEFNRSIARNACYCLAALFILHPTLASASPPPPATSGTPTVDVTAITEATCYVIAFTTGMFGALLVAVSAVGAVVSAALGDMRKAVNCVVIALGAWLIEPTAGYFFLNDSTDPTSTTYKKLDCPSNIELPDVGD